MEGSFRPHQPGLRKLLGDLEAAIMEVVWAMPPGALVTVRQVYETLLEERKVAYTTVMTVMGNLAKKHLLEVETQGTAYLYRAPLTQDEFTSRAVGDIVNELLSDFSSAALAHFARAIEAEPADSDALAALKRRIQQAKQEG
ncbi:MAG: BlaI/MecI/CopY family transcriptional regulator [Candidatus Sericytochromatia bacterium]